MAKKSENESARRLREIREERQRRAEEHERWMEEHREECERREAEYERRIEKIQRQREEHDAKFAEGMADWHAFWLGLAERIEAATSIADRKVLADEMRDRARLTRQSAIDCERKFG